MIRTEDLSFRYPDGTVALHEVNLEVRDGEFLALIGANGSGKTTLLRQLIGLLKPSSGNVFLDGTEFRHFKDDDIFRRVGMVFQDPNDQLFAATVEQDVAFGVLNLGLKAEEVTHRVREALKMVGALELAGKALHTLSFGQKRRVAIAGVLAMETGVILLDEPTGGLDPCGVSAIMHLLRMLNQGEKITMVMATHDVDLVPLFCDRVAVMSRGRLIREATPGEVFANVDMVRKAELRLPRVAHLIEILKKKDGINFPEIPLTIGMARRELVTLMAGQPQSRAEDILPSAVTKETSDGA